MGARSRVGILAIVGLLSILPGAWGQTSKQSLKKQDKQFQNWHNLDIKKNKTLGISTDKAYDELLKNKTPKRVIVAVIDGGIDIEHEDLKSKIWVNEKEIPGNGIDDDNNGFIDDIHGWNFLGNASGENINAENLEITRIYKLLSKKYQPNADSIVLVTDSLDYNKYLAIKDTYLEKNDEAQKNFDYVQTLAKSFYMADSTMQALLSNKDYTIKDLKKFKTGSDFTLKQYKDMLLRFNRLGLSRKDIIEYQQYVENRVNYHFNLNFSPRTIIGDNIEEFPGLPYGNNNVAGPDPKHGSFVAGIIGADRSNNIGIKGIADSVKIMVLRAVPDGDEYDKDVANAIIYAVNNGAQVINCSFGKSYSPQRRFVDEALRIASEKGVLIVHAAGNDAKNIDIEKSFPSVYDNDRNPIMENWITVGASSLKANKTMVANFSNYGKLTVDIFAPGYRIYSTSPDNTYEILDGTSFAAPMVAGAAALIKSVYPNLTNAQVKEIILKSGHNYSTLEILLPSEKDKYGMDKQIVPFGELSQTGSILNVYNALKLAETYSSN